MLLDRAIVTSKLSREEEALGLYARSREILEAAADDPTRSPTCS